MITKKQLETMDVTHKHAGNQWIMLEDIDGEFCRIGAYASGKYPQQVFLAAKSMLQVTTINGSERAIPSDMLPKIKEMRESIKSGSVVVKSTHLVTT